MAIDLEKLERIVADGSAGEFEANVGPATIDELIAEIKRLQSELDEQVRLSAEVVAENERLQAHNSLMKAAIEEFGEAFNQKPVASVRDDFERVNAALKDSWKERERLRDVLTERNARIAAIEAENAELAQFVIDCGGFWGHSRSQLKGDHSLLSVIQCAFEHAERLEWFIDWYLRDGKRAEIDPQGHVRATTREIIFASIDAARRAGN